MDNTNQEVVAAVQQERVRSFEDNLTEFLRGYEESTEQFLKKIEKAGSTEAINEIVKSYTNFFGEADQEFKDIFAGLEDDVNEERISNIRGQLEYIKAALIESANQASDKLQKEETEKEVDNMIEKFSGYYKKEIERFTQELQNTQDIKTLENIHDDINKFYEEVSWRFSKINSTNIPEEKSTILSRVAEKHCKIAGELLERIKKKIKDLTPQKSSIDEENPKIKMSEPAQKTPKGNGTPNQRNNSTFDRKCPDCGESLGKHLIRIPVSLPAPAPSPANRPTATQNGYLRETSETSEYKNFTIKLTGEVPGNPTTNTPGTRFNLEVVMNGTITTSTGYASGMQEPNQQGNTNTRTISDNSDPISRFLMTEVARQITNLPSCLPS